MYMLFKHSRGLYGDTFIASDLNPIALINMVTDSGVYIIKDTDGAEFTKISNI